MDAVLRYRGREITDEDVGFVRQLIAQRPEASRRALSIAVCEAWGWKQSNGELRDGVCRGLLLALHRAGHIELPVPRHKSPNPSARLKPPVIEVPATPLQKPLSAITPVQIRQVSAPSSSSTTTSDTRRRWAST